MSVSQSVVTYINALKWPVVVCAFGYYFREPLKKVALRIAEAPKGSVAGPGGIGLSWDATLREVDAALASRLGDTATAPRPDAVAPPDRERYPPNATPNEKEWIDIRELTETMRGAAVLMSFTQVEMALREHLRERGVAAELDRMGVGQLLLLGRAMSTQTSPERCSSCPPYETRLLI